MKIASALRVCGATAVLKPTQKLSAFAASPRENGRVARIAAPSAIAVAGFIAIRRSVIWATSLLQIAAPDRAVNGTQLEAAPRRPGAWRRRTMAPALRGCHRHARKRQDARAAAR